MVNIQANAVNADTVTARRILADQMFGPGQGTILTARQIILGGWKMEAKGDGLYVTSPAGIELKFELIDFRQVPVPPTADLLAPQSYEPSTATPGGPQRNPDPTGGRTGSWAGGGGAANSTPGTPGEPTAASAEQRFTPGGDGVGYQPISDAARARLPAEYSGDERFMTCLDETARRINVPVDSMLTVFQIESGLGRGGSSANTGVRAINRSTQASGLNQIMPRTAQGLGYRVEDIQRMGPGEQMCGPVAAYFRAQRMPERPTVADLYLANFYPAAVGRPDDYVLGNNPGLTPERVAAQNPSFRNSSGVITVGSVRQWIAQRYPSS